jgi:hypothetical protein
VLRRKQLCNCSCHLSSTRSCFVRGQLVLLHGCCLTSVSCKLQAQMYPANVLQVKPT